MGRTPLNRTTSSTTLNQRQRWRVALAGAALAAVLAATLVAPLALAQDNAAAGSPPTVAGSRLSATDPLNGGFLLVNMHGMLFHPDISDIQEDLAYARWLGGGVVRAFATDSSGGHPWSGTQVGARIAQIAPMLRAAHLRLIVTLVNNHEAVPGEAPSSIGWMDNYLQLLLPFYTDSWRGAYLPFVHDLISTVQWYGAQDVIFAWELGNELHTPRAPSALMPFITQAAAAVRQLDPVTPILPGTMGANHVEPGQHASSIARWLYCEAPVDAYTLHAYDWVSRDRPGDMPIDWDLDNIVSQPCPNGRALPVIVEELGTSRALPGVYTADDERGRLDQERRQIDFVRRFPQVVGFGVWNGESPRLVDRTFVDTRRGLTSYGSRSQGGGSCYDPMPDPTPGARCELEQLLRAARFVRVDQASRWAPVALSDGSSDADATSSPIVGAVDAVASASSATTTLALTGWVLDPAATTWPGVDRLDVLLGDDPSTATRIAGAQLGLRRADAAAPAGNPDTGDGFSVEVPAADLPAGLNILTLAAHTAEHGTWLSSVAVVVPNLGPIPVHSVAVPPVAPAPVPAVPVASLSAEVAWPQPGDQVGRSFVVQVLAPSADRVDVFLEPDRDLGGRLIGSAGAPRSPTDTAFRVNVTVPADGHTLYVHVVSAGLRQEQVFTIPIVVRF